MSDPRVLVMASNVAELLPMLESRFPGVRFWGAGSEAEISGALEASAAEAIFSMKDPEFSAAVHREALLQSEARWAHIGGSGYDHLLPVEELGLTLTNARGLMSPFLVETAIAAMLTLNSQFLDYDRQRRARVWEPLCFNPIEDKTLLVVGLGTIGQIMAAKAKALGMRVLAIRRRQEPDPAVDEIHPPEAFMDLLGKVDVISLHLRMSEETRHLINRDSLAAMKPGAILINTARGGVLDEEAVADALESGHLGGAYLDVFETEPLPKESRLWDQERLILTPHAAEYVPDWPERHCGLFSDNLERWLAGQPLINQVWPLVE